MVSAKEHRLDIENAELRQLLAQAGIDAAEQKVMEGLQRLLLEELHHRIKNVLAEGIGANNCSHGNGHSASATTVAMQANCNILITMPPEPSERYPYRAAVPMKWCITQNPNTSLRGSPGNKNSAEKFPTMSDASDNSLRQRVKRIGPYTAVALVLLPVMVIEPLKVVGVWVAGKGHWLTGTFVVASAYAASLLLADKLFHVLKPNMLRAPLLAEAWRRLVVVCSATNRFLRHLIHFSA